MSGGHGGTSAVAGVEERLERAGYPMPCPLPAKGLYLPVRRWGGQLWVSGHTGRGPDGPRVLGTVGADVSVEQAREEARWAAVNLLAAVHAAGALGDVEALLHVRGYVRAVPSFREQPRVVDAASELLVRALGPDVGAHARTAIGVASLPGGAPVELEAVFGCR